jgi:hypothetical protein
LAFLPKLHNSGNVTHSQPKLKFRQKKTVSQKCFRLQKELAEMLPKNVNVRVSAQKGRDNFTWNGGAHLSTLSSFQRLWLTKQVLIS